MTNIRRILALLALTLAWPLASCAHAQIELPRSAPTSGRDTSPQALTDHEAPLVLKANLGARILFVTRGDSTLKSYAVAVGQDKYPTPLGTFTIRKIVWNPSWHPPPDADWAKGKTAKGPGDPGNPMKVVKIFFQEPDYYIHGTGDVESLGSAASHGCLRMDPSEVADLAKLIMEHGGQPRGENWFWRIIHSRREEQVVYLDNPVSLTIGE
ncbi:MAG: L,D-transpeptidase ErfK/SrfK [Gemmatimonadaceae bacterium]|jgi:lipoprotein-anchoring transpeptidase ErfK/SrfK|nr:L,D-transpeptidase ErfK/SrfK [Gemmatimonadaceae bacterium]